MEGFEKRRERNEDSPERSGEKPDDIVHVYGDEKFTREQMERFREDIAGGIEAEKRREEEQREDFRKRNSAG